MIQMLIGRSTSVLQPVKMEPLGGTRITQLSASESSRSNFLDKTKEQETIVTLYNWQSVTKVKLSKSKENVIGPDAIDNCWAV